MTKRMLPFLAVAALIVPLSAVGPSFSSGATPDLPPSRQGASASLAEARVRFDASGGGKVGPTSDRLDADMAGKIRQEAEARSEILRMVHVLADVYGPRLTGSPNLKAAADWAADAMKSWGLTNTHLEAFDFGRPGWMNERFAGYIVSPVRDSLVGEVLAWTPGTNGPLTAPAFLLNVPDRPTEGDLAAYLGTVREQVGGKIVLVDRSVAVPIDINPPPKRASDDRVRERFDPTRRTASSGAGDGAQRATRQPPPRGTLSGGQVAAGSTSSSSRTARACGSTTRGESWGR
jgi:hypothetical protein